MTGKELIINTIKCEKTPRAAWLPFTGVHGASLLGISASEYLKDASKIVAGVSKSVDLYNPDGIPIAFDLQIEAEIFGCRLHWNDDNPPAVVSHPLSEGECELGDLKVPQPSDGRLSVVLDATRQLREKYPDLALYALITGPFTLALHLLGTDIFLKMFDDEEYIKEVMDFCADTAKALSKYYIECGCDVVAVVDPMTSQIGPDQFQQFCTAPCTEIFDFIRDQGALGSFFVCGHAQKNVECMCDCHCDNISIDENIPLDFVRDICQAKKISYGGNLQLTTGLLFGSVEENKINAVKCLDIGADGSFILAPGCDLPYACPPENIQAVAKLVDDDYERQTARALAENFNAEDMELPDLSDYVCDDVLKVDVITLDSQGCAPCYYMVDAARKAAETVDGAVEVVEHKIKERESVALMKALGVTNIPTLCIDKEIAFVSNIPDVAALAQVMRDKVQGKKNSA